MGGGEDGDRSMFLASPGLSAWRTSSTKSTILWYRSEPVDEAAEHQPHPMRFSTDHARRGFQDRACFVEGQLEKVAQHERGTGVVVDALERFTQYPGDFHLFHNGPVDVPPPALARHQTACAVERGEQRLQRVRGPPALALALRQGGAHRDPVQPRGEARARWKVADVAPGGQESLLQGLLAVHHHGRRDAPPTRAPRAQSPEMTPDIAIGSATE